MTGLSPASHAAVLLGCCEVEEKSLPFRTKPDQEAAAGVDPDRLCDAIIRIHLLAAKPSGGSSGLKAASDAAQHYLLSVAHAAGTGEPHTSLPVFCISFT